MSFTCHIESVAERAGSFATLSAVAAAALVVLANTAGAMPVAANDLSATVALSAGTIEEPLFTWRGTVDREVVLVLDGRRLVTQGLDARLPSNSRVTNAIPRRGDGEVRVVLQNGRGNVDVLERPSARNNYRTVVRIRDPLGGADRYQVAAYWVTDDGYGRGSRDAERDDSRGRDDNVWRNGRDNSRDRDDDCYKVGNNRNGNNRNGNVRNNGNNRGNGNGKAKKDRRDDCSDSNSRNDSDSRNGGGWDNGRTNNGRNSGNARSGPGVLRWTGRVDDAVDVIVQGNRVEYRDVSGATATRVRSTISGGALPRQEGGVSIVSGNGRGRVYVIQQPSQYNGYTAVISISDPRSGPGDYEFAARW